MEKFSISFEAMDKKEKTMMADLNLLSSNQDFIEAVKVKDLEKMAEILE